MKVIRKMQENSREWSKTLEDLFLKVHHDGNFTVEPENARTVVVESPYAEYAAFVAPAEDVMPGQGFKWAVSTTNDTELYNSLEDVARGIVRAFRRGDMN